MTWMQRFYKSKWHRYVECGTYIVIFVGAAILWGWGLWRSYN